MSIEMSAREAHSRYPNKTVTLIQMVTPGATVVSSMGGGAVTWGEGQKHGIGA